MSLVSTTTMRVALPRARARGPASSRPDQCRRHRRRGGLFAASEAGVSPSSSSSSPRPQDQLPPPLLLLRQAPEGPSSPPIVVVALGGNALLRRGEEPTAANQARHAAEAAAAAAHLFFETFGGRVRLVITHGNGPQVGSLASSQPLEQLSVLDAETQGMIGLTLANELDRALSTFARPPRGEASSSSSAATPSPSVCLVTRVVVSESDPAFSLPPTKPIGKGIPRERAEEEAARAGPAGALTFVEDAATPGLVRRAVASPQPLAIVEIDSIRRLLSPESSPASSSFSCVGPVICGGGGGVPVVARKKGGSGSESSSFDPVEAVIDKDATSCLLASLLGASALLLLTDAGALYDPGDWEASRREGEGRAPPAAVRSPASPEEVEALLSRLPEGSMRPKAASAARAAREGIVAGIGSLEDAAEILMGTKGTLVVPPARGG